MGPGRWPETGRPQHTGQEARTWEEDQVPSIWRDQLSADPAVWTEFSTKFAKRYGCEPVSPEEARSFCRDWLAGQAQRHEFYRGPLVEAFDSVATPQEWKAALAELKDS